MGKSLNFLKKVISFIGLILFLNLLVNWIFIWENNGSKYMDQYISSSKAINIRAKQVALFYNKGEEISFDDYNRINEKAYKNNNEELLEALDSDMGYSGESYIKFMVFYKGIKGGSRNLTIQDANSGRYYKIMRFDKYGDPLNTHAQSTELIDQEVYVTVDSLQYNDPNYGSRENPIVVLKYKGVNKVFSISHTNDDGESYLRPIAPTEEEYRYNVENYLTYVMSSKEFDQRFHTERSITYYLLWGLGIVVVLGGVGWFYYRRIRKDNKKQDARITEYVSGKNRRRESP